MTRPRARACAAAMAVSLLLALLGVVLPAVPALAGSTLPVLMIGDSVSAGAISALKSATRDYPDLSIDAKGCRGMLRSCAAGGNPAPNTGLDVLSSYATVPPVVLIELGYNDADNLSGIDKLMQAAVSRGAQKVVWFTISERRGYPFYRTFNAALRSATALWPQLRIADWQAWADQPQGGGWFTDGVHLTAAGNLAWASFVHAALDAHVAGAVLPPPVTPPPPPSPTRCTAEAEMGVAPALLASGPASAGAMGYLPVSPERIVDTRFGDPLGAGKTVQVPVAGVAGVPQDATAAVLTVTAVDACASGFLTVYPCTAGGPPTASTVNVTAKGVRANSTVTALTPEGTVCVYAMMRTDVVIDVVGYFGPGAPDGLQTATPTRLLDTREQLTSRPPGGTALRLQVTGDAPLAPADATAVLVNVTGVGFSNDGYVTAWPTSPEGTCNATDRPNTSTVNLSGSQPVPAQTVVPVGDGGGICLFVFSASHLVVDLGGWVRAGAPKTVTASPSRVLDTRDGTGAAAGIVGRGGVVRLPVVGVPGGAPAGASGVILNVTGVNAPLPGFVTIWPANAAGACEAAEMPTASSLNLPVGTPVPNLSVVRAGGQGAVCLFSQQGAHLVADLMGWTL